MQVATGSRETSEAAPAVEDRPSDGRVAPKRFYSIEAAAKHWAAPMGIVMRPGGYLHTKTQDAYADLPRFIRAYEWDKMQFTINRLFENETKQSVKGWAGLGEILLAQDIMRVERGPRGGVQYWI